MKRKGLRFPNGIPRAVTDIVSEGMSDKPPMTDDLRERLILAAVNVLTDSDPVLVIGVGDNEVRLGWSDE